MEKKEKGYTDRVDATYEISLYEYGFVRNPDTNDVIVCLNPSDDYEQSIGAELSDPENAPQLVHTTITLEEVREYLNEIAGGFWSFIGADKEKYLQGLDNSYLADAIFSVNQWDGTFFQGLGLGY